jgi:hypothetical protein
MMKMSDKRETQSSKQVEDSDFYGLLFRLICERAVTDSRRRFGCVLTKWDALLPRHVSLSASTEVPVGTIKHHETLAEYNNAAHSIA